MGNKHKTQVAVYNAEATHGSMPSDFVSAVKDIKLAILQARANAARLANAEALKLYFYVGGYISKVTPIRHLLSDEIRPTALGETGLDIIRPAALGEFGDDGFRLFLSLGFSFHSTILEKVQSKDERLYYVMRAAKEVWSHSDLLFHLRADDYHHIGLLPNNFSKTLAPVIEGIRRVMANARAKSDLKPKKKSAPRKTSKGGKR